MKTEKWKLIPLQMILAVLPLVLYLRVDNSGLAGYMWNSSDDTYLDMFLHGKMVVFIVLAAVILCLTVLRMIALDKQERKRYFLVFLPLFVYSGFVVVSTIFSENIRYSLWGAMDAKEPVFVLLGYVMVAFYACLVVESVEDIKALTGAAVAGSAFMALLGVLQAVGKDPLLTEGVQSLFVDRTFMETYGLLQLTFPEGMAYGTLFNPNYVGTYVALYVPLLVSGMVLYRQNWKKAVCGATCLGLLVTLFASQSRTGLIALGAVLLLAAVFLGRKWWKHWYVLVAGLVVLVAVFLMVDSRRDFLLVNRLKELVRLTPSGDPVQGVDTTGNGVRVLYKDTEFTVKMQVYGNEYAYTVQEGKEQRTVTYDTEKTYGYFILNNGDEITIQTALYEEEYAFGLTINGRNFYFTNMLVRGDYKYITELGRLAECTIPENVFPGYETAGTGRGYVWGRTIPLLKQTLFLGSGPDTFVLQFPQDDYVARYRSGFDNIVFTRPHNMYLQMGIQTGVISLVAVLVFYGIYFAGCCRRYCFCKFETPEQWVGLALCLSTVGFMAAGLANDSLIVVTPVFYVLLGAGLAVNQKMNRKPKKIENR